MDKANNQAKLAMLGVSALTDMFRHGTATAIDATGAALDQIDAHNGTVNAFSFVDREAALQAAEQSARRWRAGRPLSAIDGIPTTIKDVMMVKGWTTSLGSRVLGSEEPADWNSPAVDRLLEAGAVLIGQTTTPEIGWKGTTDNTRYGTTRNPWDTSKTPGGSSGGAAAAAALGMGVLHIGTDGGGSIRIPAGFTGIFGHKPSFGRVPTYPPSPYSTLAHAGPMTRSVEDAAYMLTTLAGPDARDWYALPRDETRYEDIVDRGIQGMKIAYSPDLGYVDVDPEIAALVRNAVERLSDLGAEVHEVGVIFDKPADMFETIWFGSVAVRVKDLPPDKRKLLDPGLLEIVEKGERIELLDFLNASVARAELGKTINQYFAQFDLLVTPSLPIPAFETDIGSPFEGDSGWWIDWTPFSYPFNLSQQPACSVPCGLTAAGLPAGMQVVGRMHDDESVLRAARAYEAACPPVFPEFPRTTQDRRE